MKSLNMFQSATLRLTAWYVAILIVLSLCFSFIVYNIAAHEIGRAFGPQRAGESRIFIDDESVQMLRVQRVEQGNRSIVANLVLFNLIVLVAGAFASYLLARRTLQPIEESHEAQSRFASDAAHELRTPLAVMQAELEVELRDTKSTKKSHEAAIRSSLEEVDRLHTLTERLLSLSSQQELELGAVQIEDVAIDAVNQVIPTASSKKISINNKVGSQNVIAQSDSLRDVLIILLDNAIKYSPDGSNIELTSGAADKHAYISITDNGDGISESELEKIFDRFYRSDESRSKTNVDGHGLGLSIARSLVDQMDGDIVVASTLGKGSNFTIKLPLASD